MSGLYEEVQLWRTPSERDRIRSLADVYAIINTLQFLQKAFIKDCIKEEMYAASCRKLLSQLREAFVLVENEFPSPEAFMEKYKMDCPGALKVIRGGPTVRDDGNKLLVRCTELFITVLDRISMSQLAKDQIQPDIRNLWEALNGLSLLPTDFDGKRKLEHWLKVMETMKASEELSVEQARTLQFDVDDSYTTFKSIIQGK